MRPPRFRLRTMIAVVAIAAALIATGSIARRGATYRARAAYHAAELRRCRGNEAVQLAGALADPARRRELEFNAGRYRRLAAWHAAMAEKYRRAAGWPWEAIPPDRPMPAWGSMPTDAE
jgi:hypothetical protein